MSPTWEFYPVKEERAATLVFGLVLVLGDGLASWGRPASPCVALFRLRRGFFQFNYYCSQRACTLEKGAMGSRRETAFPA